MISRRGFVKAIASAFLAGVGGTSLWQVWRNRQSPEGPVITTNGRQPTLSLFLLSDMHISTIDSTMTGKAHTAFRDIVRFEPPVDTIVLGGDAVDGGRESDYGLLQGVLSEYKLPKVYGLMGNHEYYDIWFNEKGEWSKESMPNGKTDAQARDRFMQFMGYKDRPYQDVWINGVHLIMLSQETYVQERPEVGEGAWYSDEQLAWLEEIMKPHADGKPALVFIHQPLPPDGEDGGQHRVIKAKRFRSILRAYRNVFVFSGHTHRNLETEGRYVRDNGFHWFSNASVGKTRGVGSVASPVQGLYIQVYPDQVVLRGREFSNRTWIEAADWTVNLE